MSFDPKNQPHWLIDSKQSFRKHFFGPIFRTIQSRKTFWVVVSNQETLILVLYRKITEKHKFWKFFWNKTIKKLFFEIWVWTEECRNDLLYFKYLFYKYIYWLNVSKFEIRTSESRNNFWFDASKHESRNTCFTLLFDKNEPKNKSF